MSILHLVPFLVLGFAALAVLHLPPGRDIWVPVFFLPWFGLTPDIGASVPLCKFLFLLVAVKYALDRRIDLGAFPNVGIIAFVTLVGLVSATITFATHEAGQTFSGGELRNGWFRVVVVTVNFLLAILPLTLIFARGVTHSIRNLLRVYIVSVLLLCLIGFIQYAIFRVTGEDILPIGLFTHETERLKSGMLNLGDGFDLRPGSLAGEPKSLGMFAVSAAIVLIAYGREIFAVRAVRNGAITIMLATIYLTQSTSALLCLGISLAIFIALRTIGHPLRRSTIFLIYCTAAIAILVVFFESVANQAYVVVDASTHRYDGSLLDTIYRRTVGRFEVEDFDWVIIKSMLDDPFGVVLGRGTGLGHLFTAPYIPDAWRHYMQDRIIFPKTGLTYLLVNGGVVAVLLMIAFLVRLTPSLPRRPHAFGPNLMASLQRAQLAIIPLVMVFMLRIYVFDVVLFVAAVCTLALKNSFIPQQHRHQEMCFGPSAYNRQQTTR